MFCATSPHRDVFASLSPPECQIVSTLQNAAQMLHLPHKSLGWYDMSRRCAGCITWVYIITIVNEIFLLFQFLTLPCYSPAVFYPDSRCGTRKRRRSSCGYSDSGSRSAVRGLARCRRSASRMQGSFRVRSRNVWYRLGREDCCFRFLCRKRLVGGVKRWIGVRVLVVEA
jgi:hypothetical protein